MTGYVVPADVAVVARDGSIFVARVPQGPIMVFEDTAAELWLLAPGATRENLPAIAAERFAVTESMIVDEVHTFVDSLLAHGLITNA